MYEIPADFADWTSEEQDAWLEKALIALAETAGIPTGGPPAPKVSPPAR